ncbi:MAG: carbamate kinase [Haloglomus sp.]
MSRAVVAIGGNAIAESGADSWDEQVATVRETVAELAPLVRDRYDEVVLTHGNGPQVGNRLLEREAADETPDLPLDALVAETQAQLGYALQRALDGLLDRSVASLVTQVVVDREALDAADPTKPVGPWYTAEEADAKPFETRQVGRGERPYRRVVRSPRPERILEAPEIRAVLDAGHPLVCGGGGGVPVVECGDGGFEGVPAVVDKDHTTRLIGEAVGATDLVFLTDVDHVYVGYGTDSERALGDVPAAELRTHLDAGEFPEGSMGPKVRACLAFLDGGGERAVVTRPEDVTAAVAGEAGTRVHPDRSP